MNKPTFDASTALIIVDVQNDFLPGGNLAVTDGDAVIAPINKYIELVYNHGGSIYASRDWHPANHISFQAQGGLWPKHCVQNTLGAQFHSDLNLPDNVVIISKGGQANVEAYSAFDSTGLADQLKQRNIKRLLIGGVATDYCVLNTVLDAIKNGFQTWLLLDAIRAVNIQAGDSERAIEKMIAAGAETLTIYDLTR